MEIIEANSKDELVQKLKNIDISVPPREEGRTTEDCERWSICRFLSTLNQLERIKFPIAIHKQERPDFYIVSAGKELGVEHTEAIPPDYAKAMVIAAKENPEAMIDMSLFKFGEQNSLDNIRKIVNEFELTGDGWAGDSAEVELADTIKKVVLGKTEKLKKDGFSKYDKNVLLIYENMPLPHIKHDIVIEKCTEKLSDYWSNPIVFDDVYIESGEQLLLLNSQGSTSFNILDLW